MLKPGLKETGAEMENNKCRAFIECVERGSISAAADSLGYTPSAISQLITSLEKELGLKILIRSQKGVRPTTEGEALLPAMRAYLAKEQDIYAIASDLKGVVSGKLSIAVYPSVATSWLRMATGCSLPTYIGFQCEGRSSGPLLFLSHRVGNRA